MKTATRTCLVLCIFFISSLARTPNFNSREFPVKNQAEPEEKQDLSGTIAVGAGYSEDSQQVTQQQCFKATVSTISEKEGEIKLDQASSFSSLENVLKIKVKVGGGFSMFSGRAKASYMRSIQDKDYSLSLNYYASFSSKVTVNIENYGMEALTEFGKATYNDSNNPYFGLLCGDQYIASYDQGALLIMGLNIELSSHEEKREFTRRAKFSFGNIFKTAGSIEEVSKKNQISGSLAIHAFQIGGEPTQLTSILHNSTVRCNITVVTECLKTANNLLDYAKRFGQQINNSTGFEPLGTGTYHPIKWLGLTPSASLVTPEIGRYRMDLANKLKENEYYTQKLYSFLEGYPVLLDDAFIDYANVILSKADDNVNILMDSEKGAAGCFNEPDRCKEIKTNIYSQLQSITSEDLKFLNSMKHTMTINYGTFYNTGGEMENSWILLPKNASDRVSVESVYLTVEYFSYVIRVGKIDTRFIYSGSWDDNLTSYVGTEKVIEKDQNRTLQTTYKKQLSPFFFENYSAL